MYQWAEAAVCELEQSDYEQLYQEEMNRSGMTHGEYNYHNIIMTREGIATMNFEKIPSGYPGRGSVLFSQKSNGEKRVEAPARRWHAECVFCNPPTLPEAKQNNFENPSEFYRKSSGKLQIHTNCMNKAWYTVKNTEKLKTAIKQTEEKKMFFKRTVWI